VRDQEGVPGPGGGGADGTDGPVDAGPPGDHGLDLILDEVDTVVEPLGESMAFGPAMGIAVAGGPMVTLPPDEPTPGRVRTDNSMKAGLRQAGPVAIAGMAVNAAAALGDGRRTPRHPCGVSKTELSAVMPWRCWSVWCGG